MTLTSADVGRTLLVYGHQMYERVMYYEEIANMMDTAECPRAAAYMRKQAEANREGIVKLGREYERVVMDG